jgi:hypothetical protein
MVQKINPLGIIWVPSIRPKFDDSNLALCSECGPSDLVVLALICKLPASTLITTLSFHAIAVLFLDV